MVRVFCIVSLALAAVSTVSGHVIRRHTKPKGWETEILQNYDQYHERYLKWDCDKQHNTAYFDKCCHPLLKGEPMSVLDELHCEDGCFDDESPVTLTATSTSSSQPAHADASPTYPPKKPVSGALGKVNDSPPPPPSSSTTTTSTPPKAAASPPPAQTSSSSSGGGDVHKGGFATFYNQKGIAGSCGTVHSDDDFICALRPDQYDGSGNNLCGKSIRITNTNNGKSVTVVAADKCPTCVNHNSIDLSVKAFQQLGDLSAGLLPIEWEFL